MQDDPHHNLEFSRKYPHRMCLTLCVLIRCHPHPQNFSHDKFRNDSHCTFNYTPCNRKHSKLQFTKIPTCCCLCNKSKLHVQVTVQSKLVFFRTNVKETILNASCQTVCQYVKQLVNNIHHSGLSY